MAEAPEGGWAALGFLESLQALEEATDRLLAERDRLLEEAEALKEELRKLKKLGMLGIRK